MISKQLINNLLNSLHNLHHQVSQYELIKRISSYRSKTGANHVHDISGSLASRINKLATESKPGTAPFAREAVANHQTESKHTPVQLDKEHPALAKDYKIGTHTNEPEPSMGETLKASTRSHIHMAHLRARSGDLSAAKLHSDIANQALKEVAHYVDEEDYKSFCLEIDKMLSNSETGQVSI